MLEFRITAMFQHISDCTPFFHPDATDYDHISMVFPIF
ncbi:MAG: hypothetical protein [Olavius algarvensis Delta 4 endosymbiont]|nr:MAG: hypothetical protein [Olavius algarvensis Delta 4 endosymbiont]